MTGQDIKGWDSATFVSFIAATEIELRVKLPLAVIESLETFGDVADAVRARQTPGDRASHRISVS
jgi:acyl carrier protein